MDVETGGILKGLVCNGWCGEGDHSWKNLGIPGQHVQSLVSAHTCYKYKNKMPNNGKNIQKTIQSESTSKVIHIHVQHLLKPTNWWLIWVFIEFCMVKKNRTPPQSPVVWTVGLKLQIVPCRTTSAGMPSQALAAICQGDFLVTPKNRDETQMFGLSSKKHHGMPWHGMTLNISKLVKLDQAWFDDICNGGFFWDPVGVARVALQASTM